MNATKYVIRDSDIILRKLPNLLLYLPRYTHIIQEKLWIIRVPRIYNWEWETKKIPWLHHSWQLGKQSAPSGKSNENLRVKLTVSNLGTNHCPRKTHWMILLKSRGTLHCSIALSPGENKLDFGILSRQVHSPLKVRRAQTLSYLKVKNRLRKTSNICKSITHQL